MCIRDRDYTFSQLITSLGVKTLPAYVDPESPGYEAALGELEGRTVSYTHLDVYKRQTISKGSPNRFTKMANDMPIPMKDLRPACH